MRKGGGKTKGSEFERKISKELSLWWSDGERDDIFWRTSVSGGRATTRMRTGLSTRYQYGDITYTDSVGEDLLKVFTIECKVGYGNYDVLDVLSSNKSVLIGFWEEAVKESGDANNIPLLIFKQDRKETLVAFSKGVLFDYVGFPNDYETITISRAGKNIQIMRLKDFLAWISPEIIKLIAKECYDVKETGN